MIRKLLKVEFRDALSSMLPIGVGMVALSALVALTLRAHRDGSASILAIGIG